VTREGVVALVLLHVPLHHERHLHHRHLSLTHLHLRSSFSLPRRLLLVLLRSFLRLLTTIKKAKKDTTFSVCLIELPSEINNGHDLTLSIKIYV
jgi:hypothetical protein